MDEAQIIIADTRAATEASDDCLRRTVPLLNMTRDQVARSQAAIDLSAVLLRRPVYTLTRGYLLRSPRPRR